MTPLFLKGSFIAFLSLFTMQQQVVVDAKFSLREAIAGTEAPYSALKHIKMIEVEYYSTDSLLHRGQILMHEDLVSDIEEIFSFMKEIKFPVEMVIPIKFDMPNGMTTMANLNNTYGFHYRQAVANTNLSKHATGRAIDINPFQNPYIFADGKHKPEGSSYNPKDARTLTPTHPVVLKFKELGWSWGGDWVTVKDYMHFEK